MSDRTPSKHMVVVFDLEKNPDVLGVLKTLQHKDKRITRLFCHGKMGTITTPNGILVINDSGIGEHTPVQKLAVEFYREFAKGDGKVDCDLSPYDTAFFSLAEIEAAKTGEVVPLHEFVGDGDWKNGNYEAWRVFLDQEAG